MPVLLPDRKANGKYVSGNNRKFRHFIKPMLAKLHDAPFDDPGWIYEIKWDGYRAIAEINKKGVRLYSRNGLSFEEDYPGIYAELKKIKKDIVLDGEIVVLDGKGKPGFQLLQQYRHDRSAVICYYVFDCLYVNGKSIEDKPLTERKKMLKGLLPENDLIKYCDHVTGRGKDFFKVIRKEGIEGMIAKNGGSGYSEGVRSSAWLKVKNIIMEEAVIAGYTRPGGSRKFFGALVLGLYKKGKLTYIGHTGTGFDEQALKDIYQRLQPLKTDESPFDIDVPVNAPVTWVKPELVCNLKYTEITGGGTRRHPVFMGLRIDKEPKEVHEELAGSTTKKKESKKLKSS